MDSLEYSSESSSCGFAPEARGETDNINDGPLVRALPNLFLLIEGFHFEM